MVAWTGLDQRNFPRVAVSCQIWIEGSDGVIETKTENLGGGGVCVILDHGLEKLSRVKLRMTLDKARASIECGGRVVWIVCSKDPKTKALTYDTGIEFTDLTSEGQDEILSFIQQVILS
jgi:hypothetical protein